MCSRPDLGSNVPACNHRELLKRHSRSCVYSVLLLARTVPSCNFRCYRRELNHGDSHGVKEEEASALLEFRLKIKDSTILSSARGSRTPNQAARIRFHEVITFPCFSIVGRYFDRASAFYLSALFSRSAGNSS